MKISIQTISLFMGILSALLILVSGPGTRIGLYPFTVGLLLIFLGFLVGLAAVIVSVIALFSNPQYQIYAVLGLLLGAVSFGLIAGAVWSGRKAPMIHQVSTDTIKVPKFVSILPLRAHALNPVEYTEDNARKQTAAFPDIKTIHVKLSPGEAFEKALSVVHTLKWKLVDEKKDEGRIEAYDTTFWFGFKDDVVIRIVPEKDGSAVDIRSLSRVGGGDLGTNAKRVRKFLAIMKG
jgi:uncharacterized protein (DUF1499 family)